MNKKEIYEIAKENNLFSFPTKQGVKSIFTREVLKNLTTKTNQDQIVNFVLEVADKIQKRKKNKQPIKDLKSQLLNIRKNKIQVKFKNYFTCNYRSPSSSWVDQNNSYKIEFTKDHPYRLDITVNTVYHQKHNWKANELTATLYLPINTKLSQLQNIGGMLTVFTSKYSCIWFSQSKGFTVNTHEGWCINDFHIERSDKINTLSEALKYYKSIKLKQLKKQAKEEAKLNKLVTIEDSVKAGNCLTGSISFKNKYFPDRDAVTVKEILEKEDTVFTRRLLLVA